VEQIIGMKPLMDGGEIPLFHLGHVLDEVAGSDMPALCSGNVIQ